MMLSMRLEVLILCIIVIQYQYLYNGSTNSSRSIFCFATSSLLEDRMHHLRQVSVLLPASLPRPSSSPQLLFLSSSFIRGRHYELVNDIEVNAFMSTQSPLTNKSDHSRNVHYHRTLSTSDQSKLYWIGVYTFLFCSMVILISILFIFGILPSLRAIHKYDDNDNNIPNHYNNTSYCCCCCWYGRSTLILLFRSSTRTMMTEDTHDTQSVTLDQPPCCTNHTTTIIPKNDEIVVQIDQNCKFVSNDKLNTPNDNHNTTITTTNINQIHIPTIDKTTTTIQNTSITSSMNNQMNHNIDVINEETKQMDVSMDLSNHDNIMSTIITPTPTTTTTTTTTAATNNYCYNDYNDQDHTILVDVYHHYEYQEDNDTDNMEIY